MLFLGQNRSVFEKSGMEIQHYGQDINGTGRSIMGDAVKGNVQREVESEEGMIGQRLETCIALTSFFPLKLAFFGA